MIRRWFEWVTTHWVMSTYTALVVTVLLLLEVVKTVRGPG